MVASTGFVTGLVGRSVDRAIGGGRHTAGMGTPRASIDEALAQWFGRQHLFFVATSPLAADGHVNLSPKGLDTFRVLGPNQVAYLDLTGSGAETIAHVRENGRLTLMFCAFE